MIKKLLAILLIAASALGEVSILNTFTSGELSPHLDARVDFEKYKSGCRTMENFVVLPYGGALKRSGTQYIAATKSNGVARLAPFSVGVDQTYIMELGAGYIRFYSDGVQLVDTSSVPIEVSTPYRANDVFEVQIAQFADTVYMVHPDHPVQKLQRTTTAPTFTIAELEFDWPATIEENLTDITITPSATTGSVTLTASSAIWTTNHIGADWVLRSPNANDSIETTAAGTSDVINVEGNWNLITTDIITAGESITIQISEDEGNTWGDYRKYDGRLGVNFDRSGTESEQGVKYRLVQVGTGSAYFKSEEPYINGFVTITNYLSATQVQAVVKSELGSTDETEIWYEGAFSKERGYPRSVEFFQNRLWFGGTPYQVNTLWCSATDDYENFKTGSYDDSALQIAINSDNIVEWLLARNQLFVGTLGDEWVIDGGDSATPVSPTSILARRQTSFGSKDGIDALIASDSIVYLQRQGRKLREFEYSLESDAYKSVDITLLAEHITKGGITQIAEQQQPEPIIWCVRGDGQLVGMTYNKLQNVYGWHRNITDGEFESVAVIPTDGEDRVYVVVNRENGRYIEWFRPVDWGADDEDAWFVDSGLDYDGGDAVTITDMTIGTNEAAILGQTRASTEWYNMGDNSFTNSAGSQRLSRDPYDDRPWEVNQYPVQTGEASLYSDNTTNAITPPHTNWYWYSNIEPGSGRRDTNGRFYYKDVTVTADNEFEDGDNILLSGQGGILFAGLGDGIFVATNCTSTNFNLSYKDGTEVYAYGSYTGGVTAIEVQNTFTNVSHLAGQTVSIFADGGVQPDATVSTNGVLTTRDYYNRVIAGLPYTARLSPMYIDVVNSQGSSYGKMKTPYKVHFRVNKSGVFQYGSATNELYDVTIRSDTLPVGQPVPFFSGDPTTKPIDTATSTSPEFWVVSAKPLPLEVLSLTIFTQVVEYE